MQAAHSHWRRLLRLAAGEVRPPEGRARIMVALLYALMCHVLFAAAVLAMIVAMFFGMSRSLGQVPQPWAWLANMALIVQFLLGHSLLLTARGRRWLARLAPQRFGRTLSTTTYALVASAQLRLLFVLWTQSGIVWWRAEGAALVAICGGYASSWLLLVKASYDARAEVQSGALGWMSLMRNVRPVFPDLPTGGLFRLIRQPIYLAFALTLWTVPVWTPDQLLLATCFTAYCVFAPRFKERRFTGIYGDRFRSYQARVPHMVPRFRRSLDG